MSFVQGNTALFLKEKGVVPISKREILRSFLLLIFKNIPSSNGNLRAFTSGIILKNCCMENCSITIDLNRHGILSPVMTNHL